MELIGLFAFVGFLGLVGIVIVYFFDKSPSQVLNS